jgi:hypothetical protein
VETSSNSINEEDEDAVEDSGSSEWGLSKGMELFEVSAKDDTGACLEVLVMAEVVLTIFCDRYSASF